MFDDEERDEYRLAPELSAYEKQLSQLQPAEVRVDRDRLMFAAGKEAGAASFQPRRLGYIAEPFGLGLGFWRAATLTMTAATVLLAVMLVWQERTPSVAETSISNPIAQAVSESQSIARDFRRPGAAEFDPWKVTPASANGYLGIRYAALTKGIGSLSPDLSTQHEVEDRPSKPASARDLLQELLPESERRRTGQTSSRTKS